MSILMLLLCAICDVGLSLVGLTIVFCGLVSAAVVLSLLHRRHPRHHQRRRRCSPCRLLHKGRCARKEIPIFLSLLDRTLVLCVHKDISEAAISNLVRIITGVPVHDQQICRVSRRTGTWVRNERVLVLFRLRGGVAWHSIPLQDQTADFLRTTFWSLHASMGHPTTAQMTLLFEVVYADPFCATLRSVSSSMLDNVKTELAEVAVSCSDVLGPEALTSPSNGASSRPAPVRNPPAILSLTPASDSGPTESTDPAPLIKHEFSAAQSPRSDPKPHPDIPPRKRVKREAHCPSEHSPRPGDEVGCTFRSHTEAVAYLNKIGGELAIHNSFTSKSAGRSNWARIGCRIWGRLKQHGPLKETSRARPEKQPRPLTKSDLCPYGATLTHDPGTGLWKLTECNWDHSYHFDMSTPSRFMWFTLGSTWECRGHDGDHTWVIAAANAPLWLIHWPSAIHCGPMLHYIKLGSEVSTGPVTWALSLLLATPQRVCTGLWAECEPSHTKIKQNKISVGAR